MTQTSLELLVILLPQSLSAGITGIQPQPQLVWWLVPVCYLLWLFYSVDPIVLPKAIPTVGEGSVTSELLRAVTILT